MREEARPVVFVLLAGLCFALAVGVGGWFHQASALGVAITLWTLTAVVLLACWKIQVVNHWAVTVDLRWLVAWHLTRFVGIYFLILGRHGDLPEGFARPAGIGDISIAAAAAIILLVRPLHSRRILLIWNGLGLIDILFVVFGALRFGMRDWLSMAPLRELPLSLLPMFLVPLVIASHILIFVRLKVDAASSRVVK